MIGTFLLIGAIFIPIGIVIVVYSNRVHEVEVRYDNLVAPTPNAPGSPYPLTCAPHLRTKADPTVADPNCSGDASECTIEGIGFERDYTGSSVPQVVRDCSVDISITLEHDMNAPVYFYYKLSNFYQNHRRYVKSRSDTQLAAKGGDTSTCDPLETDDQGKQYYPCGLIAGSFFVDRFSASVQRAGSGGSQSLGNWSSSTSNWEKDGIAWSSDKTEKFKFDQAAYDNPDYNHNGLLGVKLPPVDDEDFIVWMRTAGLPTFKKLYRRINTDLKAGDTITISALNYYPVAAFSGEKYVVLSTTSWLGGRNSFLGWAYIVVGIICFVLAAAFAIKHVVSPRPLGDMKYFNVSHTHAQGRY